MSASRRGPRATQRQWGGDSAWRCRGGNPAYYPRRHPFATTAAPLLLPPSALGTPPPATPFPGNGNGEYHISSKASSNSSPSANVLYAVIALVQDMDEDSLQIVKAEVKQRLAHG